MNSVDYAVARWLSVCPSIHLSVCLSVCLSHTGILSLCRGRFVVVHPYLTFSVDPQNFLLWAKLYKKLPFFVILGAVSPHFLNDNGEIWHESVDL